MNETLTKEKSCDNCSEIACSSDCYDFSHWTPIQKTIYSDCPECLSKYPFPHSRSCSIGEAFS